MGQTLSQPATHKKTESGGNDKYYFAISDMQGWRIEMEDAHAINLSLEEGQDETNAFFAVYDGHGGASVAKYAGENVHKKLISDNAYKSKDYPLALKNAFLGTDADMRSSPQFQRDSSGCTAVAALATSDGKIYVANAGDSRSVISVKGEAKPLSYDHKPQNETEKSRIVAAGGYIEFGRVNGNLALARALGDFEYKKNTTLGPEKQIITCDPEIMEHSVTDEDEFLVIACDGIWDCLSSQQVVDVIRLLVSQGKTLPEICEEICELCLAPDTDGRGGIGCDNMTILIIATLHGRTIDEWYSWVTDRTKRKYGYNTPEELPQLYANSALIAFRARREAYEARQREREQWRKDNSAEESERQRRLMKVLTIGHDEAPVYNPITGVWSTRPLMFAPDDDESDSGDEFEDADEANQANSFGGISLGQGYQFDPEQGDITKSLREQLDELEKEGEADDFVDAQVDALMEDHDAGQPNLQGEAPPPPKPTTNGDATPKQFASTPGGDAPSDVLKVEGLMDTSESPLKV